MSMPATPSDPRPDVARPEPASSERANAPAPADASSPTAEPVRPVTETDVRSVSTPDEPTPTPQLKRIEAGPSSRPLLRIGHSPDPDDAFMWFPLTGIDGGPPLIDTGRFRFAAVMRDIETLNRHAEQAVRGGRGGDGSGRTGTGTETVTPGNTTGANAEGAMASGSEAQTPDPAHGPHTPLPATPAEAEPLPEEPLEITAISIGQYPFVADAYALTACGASLGLGYGPRIVARPDRQVTLERIRSDPSLRMAIPGLRTSAFLALRLLIGKPPGHVEVVPFDLIPERVAGGDFDAGLIIHEGQLTFTQFGLVLVADLGALFEARYNLPLPLGGNAILRRLEDHHGPGTLEEITATLKRSIVYAMEHREQAIDFALRHARGMTRELADEFVSMYVNRHTLEYGDTGRAAVERFLAEAEAEGLVPAPPDGVHIVQPREEHA